MYIIIKKGRVEMHGVNVTELRNHLPKYLASVMNGNEFIVTSHGQAIARIIPIIDVSQEAKKQLSHLRKTCKVGDVVTPVDISWNAE